MPPRRIPDGTISSGRWILGRWRPTAVPADPLHEVSHEEDAVVESLVAGDVLSGGRNHARVESSFDRAQTIGAGPPRGLTPGFFGWVTAGCWSEHRPEPTRHETNIAPRPTTASCKSPGRRRTFVRDRQCDQRRPVMSPRDLGRTDESHSLINDCSKTTHPATADPFL